MKEFGLHGGQGNVPRTQRWCIDSTVYVWVIVEVHVHVIAYLFVLNMFQVFRVWSRQLVLHMHSHSIYFKCEDASIYPNLSYAKVLLG